MGRFGNQNEIYSSGKDLGKLIENPTILDVHFFPLIGMAEVDPRTDWKQVWKEWSPSCFR